jgi:hypothetical protein
MSDSFLTGYGERLADDQAVCVKVGEMLAREYPGIDWMVGVDHEAGTVAIDIMCDKPIGMEKYGYLLHLSSIMGPDGQRKVRNAGGELMERFGIRRDRPGAEWRVTAAEHGLDIGGNHNKSRH